MRIWLLTSTTFGTWLPGDRRGSVTSVRDPLASVRIEHDLPGEPYEDSIPELAESARLSMNGPAVFLDAVKAEIVARQFRETAAYREWTIRALAIMYNHFHIVVEVPGNPSPGKLLGDFKSYASRSLNRTFGELPTSWWTHDGSKRILKDELAVANAIRYVLEKQPNPLVVWHPEMDCARSGG
jgi:REP element-mobilizing transposase RayT